MTRRFACLVCALCVLCGVSAATAQTTREQYGFERAVEVPASSARVACLPVDAALMEHTNGALRQLRFVRRIPAGGAAGSYGAEGYDAEGYDAVGYETEPFTLTESGSAGQVWEPAEVQTLHIGPGTSRAGDMAATARQATFQLRLPARPYTQIVFSGIHGAFHGEVTLWRAGSTTPLGTFPVVGAERGPGAATVDLQESGERRLRGQMRLQFYGPYAEANAAAWTGLAAEVPPSREAQVLWTQVAQTTDFAYAGSVTTARLRLAAHVPVERISFALARGAPASWTALATVRAEEQMPGADATGATEIVQGNLYEDRARGTQPAAAQLAFAAVLGANLQHAANVEVSVDARDSPGSSLPLRSVTLQMRSRQLCFAAPVAGLYELEYGEAAAPGAAGGDVPAARDVPAAHAAPSSIAAAVEARSGPERRIVVVTPQPATSEPPSVAHRARGVLLASLACGLVLLGLQLGSRRKERI